MTDMQKVQGKVKGGIMGMLKGVAFGGFVLAILAFINSPYFDRTMKCSKILSYYTRHFYTITSSPHWRFFWDDHRFCR